MSGRWRPLALKDICYGCRSESTGIPPTIRYSPWLPSGRHMPPLIFHRGCIKWLNQELRELEEQTS